MPKVQAYNDRQVQSQGFRTPVLQQPADATSGLIKGVTTYLEDKRVERVALDSEEQMQGFINDSNSLLMTGENPYYGTQGKMSMELAEPTIAGLEKLKQQYMDQVMPDGRLALEKSINSRINSETRRIYERALKGQSEYKVGLATTGIEGATENILLNYTDDAKIRASIHVIGENLKDTMPGASVEERTEKQQTIVSKSLSGAIDRALSVGDVAEAERLRETYDGNIEPQDKTSIDTKISAKKQLGEAQATVDELYNPDDSLNQGKAKVREAVKDPETRKAAEALYEARWNDQKQTEAEFRSDTYNTMDLELDAVSAQQRALKIGDWQAQEGWEMLTSSQRDALRRKAAGLEPRTSKAVYSELNRLYHADNKKAYSDYLEANADHLSSTDYKSFDDLRYKSPSTDQVTSYLTKKQRLDAKTKDLGLSENQLLDLNMEIETWYTNFQKQEKRKPQPQELDSHIDYLLMQTEDLGIFDYIPFVNPDRTFESRGQTREQLDQLESLRAAFERRYGRQPLDEEIVVLQGLMDE
jgi:hypothetical protein